MTKEGIASNSEKPRFNWKVKRSDEYKVDIRLHKGDARESIGEFSFHITKEKNLGPDADSIHTHDDPSYYSSDYIEKLRSSNDEEDKKTLKAIETTPVSIARVGMWYINDEARNSLTTVRQMLKLALQEFKKYKIEYFVGSYTPQSWEGLSVAPYTEDIYKRLATISGGYIRYGKEFWVSVAGLEKWLTKSTDNDQAV